MRRRDAYALALGAALFGFAAGLLLASGRHAAREDELLDAVERMTRRVVTLEQRER